MDTLRAFAVVVEVWGWDEAFLGAETDDPEALAAEMRAAVLAATGLSCSIGIGDNKLQAKIATGFAKPAGVHRLTSADWLPVMGDRPTEALWGIGKKTARELAELGHPHRRRPRCGRPGRTAGALRPDDRPVDRRDRPRTGRYDGQRRAVGSRSLSHQTTYPEDLTTRAEIEARLTELAAAVTKEVVAEDRWVERAAITVRFRSFYTPTGSPSSRSRPGTPLWSRRPRSVCSTGST